MSSLASLRGCPCLGCEDFDRCTSGTEISPRTCLSLTKWMNQGGDPRPAQAARGWLQCPYCQKRLPTERGLKIHVTRVHKCK